MEFSVQYVQLNIELKTVLISTTKQALKSFRLQFSWISPLNQQPRQKAYEPLNTSHHRV